MEAEYGSDHATHWTAPSRSGIINNVTPLTAAGGSMPLKKGWVNGGESQQWASSVRAPGAVRTVPARAHRLDRSAHVTSDHRPGVGLGSCELRFERHTLRRVSRSLLLVSSAPTELREPISWARATRMLSAGEAAFSFAGVLREGRISRLAWAVLHGRPSAARGRRKEAK